jgi:hypothetical protein
MGALRSPLILDSESLAWAKVTPTPNPTHRVVTNYVKLKRRAREDPK